MQYLVNHGADVNYINVHSKRTCLMEASEKGYFDIVQYLLENGADTVITDIKGQSALHMTAENGHLSITKLLVDSGMTMTKDNDGLTPLMLAANNCKTVIVEYLSSLPECSRKDIIDANELLGSAWMFNKHYDLSEAHHYFQKAMHERFDNPDDYVPKRIVPTDV